MKKIMIIMSSLCIFHAYALEEKDIENANEGITHALRNSLDLLSISVSKSLPFAPDFNPYNSLRHKVICKDQNGKDLYTNDFKTQLINRAKDFWCTFNKTNTLSEILIVDSINLDYVFTLYNVQKTYVHSSFFKSPNNALFELQILQQIICLKILQDCITKKQPTPFMKQNNLFKIFSDFAKDYSQMIDLEVFETPSSPSTSAHIMHLNAMYRLHFISLVEMLLKIILKQITLKHNILFSTNIHNNHYYDNISFFIYTHLQNDLKSFSLGDFFRPMEKMFDGQKISQELQEFCSGKLHYYAFTLIQQMRIWGILNSQTTFKEYNASQITILREYDINRLQLYHLHALVFSLDNEAKRFSNPQPQISQSLSQKRENAAVKTRTNMIKKINQQLSIFASDPHFNESNADFILAAYNILQKIQDTDLQSVIGDSIHSLIDKLKIDANPDLGDSLFNEDQMSQINAFFWFPPSAQAINYHKKALEAFLLSKESAPSDEDNLSSIDLDNIHQWGIINS